MTELAGAPEFRQMATGKLRSLPYKPKLISLPSEAKSSREFSCMHHHGDPHNLIDVLGINLRQHDLFFLFTAAKF